MDRKNIPKKTIKLKRLMPSIYSWLLYITLKYDVHFNYYDQQMIALNLSNTNFPHL